MLLCLSFNRINKRGSQKDVEQKKNGNYFFYDDGADEEEFKDILRNSATCHFRNSIAQGLS
jgi:hypothetical protein